MGMDNRLKFGQQQDKTGTNIIALPCTLQRQQGQYRYHRRVQNRPWSSTLAKTRKWRIKTNSFCQPLLKRRRKKYSIRELELLVVVWGLEGFRFHLYGKQVQLFSDHQALEPLLKRNKTNKQYSARLARWLDRMNHFDICLKHTAGKEINSRTLLAEIPPKILNRKKITKKNLLSTPSRS